MNRDDWNSLIPRLERDLEARGKDDPALELDDDAWISAARLLERYGAILRGRFSLPASDIDDVVQEVLVKLQSRDTLRRLKSAGSPTGYVVAMLRNAAVSFIRRERRDVGLEASELESVANPFRAEREGVTPEKTRRLREALEELKPDERAILRMRFWRGWSIGRIAEYLGTSYSAAAVRLFRILHKLRDRLGPNL